eukprot:2847019-Amphidinium_carterae.1
MMTQSPWQVEPSSSWKALQNKERPTPHEHLRGLGEWPKLSVIPPASRYGEDFCGFNGKPGQK